MGNPLSHFSRTYTPSPVKRLSLLFTVLLLIGGLAACGGNEAPSTAAQLQVEDFAFTRLEDGTRLFTGKVYNPTSQAVEQAQISVTLFDANNRRTGRTGISVSGIAPQDTTTFRQVFDSDQDVSSARVQSLTVL